MGRAGRPVFGRQPAFLRPNVEAPQFWKVARLTKAE